MPPKRPRSQSQSTNELAKKPRSGGRNTLSFNIPPVPQSWVAQSQAPVAAAPTDTVMQDAADDVDMNAPEKLVKGKVEEKVEEKVEANKLVEGSVEETVDEKVDADKLVEGKGGEKFEADEIVETMIEEKVEATKIVETMIEEQAEAKKR